MRPRPTTLCLVISFVVLLIATAGCGGSSNEPVVVDGFQVLEVIDVHEQEYSLTPSAITIDRLGYYGIQAINDGTMPHALAVVGPGVSKHTGQIPPGESRTFAVYFQKEGTYRLTCPLDDHAAKGMKATISVH